MALLAHGPGFIDVVLLPPFRRLDGNKPNNGYINGTLIYSAAYSQNTSAIHDPYQKTASSPVWKFGTIYRMDANGTNIELVASGELMLRRGKRL